MDDLLEHFPESLPVGPVWRRSHSEQKSLLFFDKSVVLDKSEIGSCTRMMSLVDDNNLKLVRIEALNTSVPAGSERLNTSDQYQLATSRVAD